MNKYLLIVLFSVLVNSCIDPFWPEFNNYEDNLVVDGIITNQPGPYYIRLQFTSTVYYPKFQPLKNATVFITDDLGNVENLNEIEDGVYTNSSPFFQGVIGRSYQLSVSYSENKLYQSSWEKIREPLEIENIYAEIESHIDPNVSHNLIGYQFYVDTKAAKNDSTFLIWKMQSTYKFESSYRCFFIYRGSIEPFPNVDSLRICWKTQSVPKIIVGSTKAAKDNQLVRYPLHYVSSDGWELSIRYSVLVNQCNVSEEVYNYWKSVRDQNEIQGSLYSQQPYQIRGNMKNINNPNEPVVGCFVAAGVDTKRVYYNRPDIDFNYEICFLGEADYKNMMDLRGLPSSYYPVYLTMDATNRKAFPNQNCIDCRERGGKLEKPDFWTDN